MEKEQLSPQDDFPAQSDLAIESRNKVRDFGNLENPKNRSSESLLLLAGQVFPFSSESHINDIKKVRREVWEITGFIPPIAGGTSCSSKGVEESTPCFGRSLDQQKLGITKNTGQKQFIWSEDLSPNGQKTYLLLISDIGLREYLSELAELEAIDLHAGLEELRCHNILDERDKTIIRINLENL